MYKAAILGDRDSIYGFAALGLEIVPVAEKAEAALAGLENERGFRAVTCTEAEGVRFIPPLS